MARLACILLWLAGSVAGAVEPAYELAGRIVPGSRALVQLYGATRPFNARAFADTSGKFRFRKLRPDTYTIAFFVRGRGEARQTIEIGPSLADARRRVVRVFELGDGDFTSNDAARRRNLVTARQLAIPDKARNEYRAARSDLEKHRTASAIAHLEKAVRLAPQFVAAWNNLGTINYQSRSFARAEECFRNALAEESDAYEPLVNLGGVLVTEHKLEEALGYNIRAVTARPKDALANSQMGLNYFLLGRFELAEKYLTIARQLDPAHFSHPQLTMAEIHLRRQQPRLAADDLEDFLRHHPDWSEAAQVRSAIVKLRQ